MEKKQEKVWWNRSGSGSEEKKRFRLRKDQLLIGLLTGILLLMIALPSEHQSGWSSMEKEKTDENLDAGNTGVPEVESRINGSLASDAYTREMENRLAEILSNAEGVGAVNVFITWKSTVEKVVEKDMPGSSRSVEEMDSSGGSRSTREETTEIATVYEESEGGSRVPYVVKEIQPRAEGVLVIAQGGGNAAVAQQILEAVQALFSLDTHKIKIMKMEGSK